MADISLTIIIPDEYQSLVIDSFSRITDRPLKLSCHSNDFEGSWEFSIAGKTEEESYLDYGKRVICELGKAVINLVDLKDDTDRYVVEVGAIDLPESDIPNDVLE